ncbi:hypothetical protein ABR737_34350 [Streptomyces sp. Edi2]
MTVDIAPHAVSGGRRPGPGVRRASGVAAALTAGHGAGDDR